MCSYIRSFIKVVKLLLGFIFSPVLFGDSGEISKPVGSLSILLPPGTTNSPSYTIAAAGLKSTVVFRGQVKQVSGNDIVRQQLTYQQSRYAGDFSTVAYEDNAGNSPFRIALGV